ncbi:putative ubiquinone biosynthesis accessory factor UbiK [Gammaproteobacteria bacterium]
MRPTTVFDPKILDELTARLSSLLPAGALEFQRDVEKNLRAALSSAFARLDLVTREEFEVQKALLERTQDRLTALERQMESLMARKSENSPTLTDGTKDRL